MFSEKLVHDFDYIMRIAEAREKYIKGICLSAQIENSGVTVSESDHLISDC